MGKVLATWLVKVVARELDEPDPDAAELGVGGFAVNATAERTDI